MGRKKKKSELESEFKDRDRKPSFITKIVDYLQPATQLTVKKAPVTVNVGISIVFFFIWISIMITGGPSQPALFLLILPTLYIIGRYIKLEREKSSKQQSD